MAYRWGMKKKYSDIEDAVKGVRWMILDMTREEELRLQSFLEHHLVKNADGWRIPCPHIIRWAVISWEKL